VNTPNDDPMARRYRFLLVFHTATLFVALVIGLAVNWHGKQVAGNRHHSTYERATPHLTDWPRRVRPLPRA
jgi:hypothetical protein